MAKIKGRIIRILDKRTVIINLGSADGITNDSIFSIMGEPEPVIDPETKEELGKVTIVKTRVKASEVAERFTIATSKWTQTYAYIKAFDSLINLQRSIGYETETEEIDEGELNVESFDIEPWKAKSVIPVRLGDIVEVNIKNNPQDDGKAEKDANTQPEEDVES